MKIHSLATFSDWFNLLGTYGPEGIQRMCDLVAEAGISRLYIRTHDGGLANYPSVRCQTFSGDSVEKNAPNFLSLPQSTYNYVRLLDYRHWDPVATFQEAAPGAGLEGGAWYTLMEDDHGGPFGSQFYKAHPEWRCVNRDNEQVDGCLEFWFEEVRDYKLAILDELLDRGAPHILLDLVRRNGTPSADGNGFCHYGFNPEIVAAFQAQGGQDPRTLTPGSEAWLGWIDFLSRPYTEFFIEAGRRIRARGASLQLLTWPVHLKTWMAIDLEAILDAGHVDAVHVGSHAYSYAPAELDNQLAALRPQVGVRPVRIVPSICGYEGLVSPGVDAWFAHAARQGVETAVLHESDVLFRYPLASRFRALSFGAPHFRRELRSRQTTSIDWAEAEKILGFLRGFNEDTVETGQLTEIQAAHTDQELCVRMICHERDTAGLIPVPRYPEDNYNVKVLGARLWWNPKESVHLFLSMPGQYGDYFHFIIDPANEGRQERRLDPQWQGEWSHDVEIGESSWTATFRIPFATLNHVPGHGQRIAVHATRYQSRPMQLSTLNLTGVHYINPEEFGFLNLTGPTLP